MKHFKSQHESIADGLDLRGDDGEHGCINPIEFVKASPGSTLGKTREDLPNCLHTHNKWIQKKNVV